MAPSTTGLLWAKHGHGKDATSYHPLSCHVIDVASVALAMWRQIAPPALRRGLASGLGIDEPATERWVAFLAGLHDLGKASPGFQAKVPAARAALEAAGWPFPATVDDPGHGLVSAAALEHLLPAYGLPPELATPLAVAVGGHHGVLPLLGDIPALQNVHVCGPPPWMAARQQLADQLA
ncbi:MAG TPA: CRISPR-associated endonuclease Cas3'', partial [Thermomicrobiaceae bacterium]|nr:CRISPR-associated endonuclease Cas3'' [Thermomicrobiaceae bacterium]